MTIIHIPGFAGQAPRIARQKLQTNQAQVARDCDLFSGDLRPARAYKQEQASALTSEVKSIYKLAANWVEWTTDVDVVKSPLGLNQDDRIYYTGDKNPKTTDNSLYTGPTTNGPHRHLGIPAPENPLIVTSDASGAGANVTLSYLYSYYTSWGEEGPPSPATTATFKVDDNWTAANTTVPYFWPEDNITINNAVAGAGFVTITFAERHLYQTGEYCFITDVLGMTDLINPTGEYWAVTRVDEYNITVPCSTGQTYTGNSASNNCHREAQFEGHIWFGARIYRTDTTTGEYKLLKEIPSFGAISATEQPQLTDSQGNLGEKFPTDLDADSQWLPPRVALQGLIALPFGGLAGFKENTLAFSEPYMPHAWPRKYELSFPFPIVAIGTFGHNIVVATTGRPYIVTGTHPDSMGQADLEINQACVSKRGMVSFANGVAFPSPDGLVYVPGAGRPQLITQSWLKKHDWAKYKPDDLLAKVFDGRYYGFYKEGGSDGVEKGAFVFDPTETAASFVTLADYATAGYVELESDTMYLMIDGNIVEWVAGGGYRTYRWFSKVFIVNRPMAPRVAQVRSEVLEGISAADRQAAIDAAVAALEDDITNDVVWNNGGFGGFSINQFTVAGGPFLNLFNSLPKQYVTRDEIFRLYADGLLKVEHQITGSDPFRIHAGYRTQEIEIEITGSTAAIQSITVAENPSELSAI